MVYEEFEKGTDYCVIRGMLVGQSKDSGWLQVSANLGYATIGLLYGEGGLLKVRIVCRHLWW